MKPLKTAQRGVGLIENLVAMLVLLIGLLGMAGLVLHVMRQAGRSEYESQAANAAQMVLGAAFAQAAGGSAVLQGLNGVTTANTGNVQGALLQALQEWAGYTQAALPPGSTGSLQVTAPGGGACSALPCVLTVTMNWSDHDRQAESYVVSQVMGY